MVAGGRELIDTLWNVNALASMYETYGTIELIDTLWNVNLTGDLDNRTTAFELIDTLWNVNNEETNTEENKTGINRYIMECKFF